MPQNYEKATQNLPIRKIIFNNFIGGAAWALGATIGLSLILAILSLIANRVNVIPIIGSFVSQIIDFVLRTNSHLQK
jgi:Na+-translocating ferredoxin:NAD+ oxidoreductase RnfA subunit